jgi:hypothetical protein
MKLPDMLTSFFFPEKSSQTVLGMNEGWWAGRD